MKYIIVWASVLWISLSACHETTIGYLNTENASYLPDTLIVRKTPHPVMDALRIKKNAPWVSLAMQGYEGTEQIYFSVESVTSTEGEVAAQEFKKELSIRGGGTLMFPLENRAKPGRYTVSVRLSNDGYSQVVEKAFTFIVEDK